MKWLKWGLFALGGLATLVCLFYAEENWRGARAWEKVRKEIEARGEPVTFEEFVPLPVPDSENMAATPLIQNLFLERKEDGPTSDLPSLKNFTFFKEYPHGSWRMARPWDWEAWKKEQDKGLSPGEQKLSGTEFILQKHQGVENLRQELIRAAALSHVRYPVDYDKRPLISISIPHIGSVVTSGRFFEMDALASLGKGNSPRAFEDLIVINRMMEGLLNEPFLISYLVGLTLQDFQIQIIWDGLRREKWDGEQLKTFQQLLEKQDWIDGIWHSFLSERVASFEMCDWLKTAAHIDVAQIMGGKEDLGLDLYKRTPSGWLDQNKVTYQELFKVVLARPASGQPRVLGFGARELSRRDALQAQTIMGWRSSGRIMYSIVAGLTMAAVSGAERKAAEIQAGTILAETAVALERYRLAKGDYPESLEVLVPMFMGSLPLDPIDGKTLRYRREGNRFLLWSVGLDEIDGGGVVKEEPKKPGNWAKDEGDWVWSYEPLVPVKSETAK